MAFKTWSVLQHALGTAVAGLLISAPGFDRLAPGLHGANTCRYRVMFYALLCTATFAVSLRAPRLALARGALYVVAGYAAGFAACVGMIWMSPHGPERLVNAARRSHLLVFGLAPLWTFSWLAGAVVFAVVAILGRRTRSASQGGGAAMTGRP